MSNPGEISKDQMVEWLRGQKTRANALTFVWSVAVIDAILAALADKGGVSEEKKALSAFLLGLAAIYRKARLHGIVDVQDNFTDEQVFRTIDKIRAILGNQSGAVSPDTQVSPHGETGGAVRDIATWAERIHADANLGVMHVQHLLEELLREAGVAGKEEK